MIRVNKYGNDMSREKQVESDISLFTGIGKYDKDHSRSLLASEGEVLDDI